MEFLNAVIAGLSQGAVYSIVAFGFAVTMATTKVMNFAHGQFLMVGGIVTIGLVQGLGLPVAFAIILAIVCTAVLGGLEEIVAVHKVVASNRPGTSSELWIISTLGVSIVLTAVVSLIAGPQTRDFPNLLSQTPTAVGGIRLIPQQVLIVAAAVLLFVVLRWFYRSTMTGKALEAVAQDRDAARLRGLPVGGLAVGSFVVGSALAGVAGILVGPLTEVSPSSGLTYVLYGFVALAVGGIPTLSGALVGGLLLGVIESVTSYQWGAGYESAVVFGVLIAILLIRPQGMFGKVTVRAV
jgi:branched-chain amino acid transport system permease protein